MNELDRISIYALIDAASYDLASLPDPGDSVDLAHYILATATLIELLRHSDVIYDEDVVAFYEKLERNLQPHISSDCSIDKMRSVIQSSSMRAKYAIPGPLGIKVARPIQMHGIRSTALFLSQQLTGDCNLLQDEITSILQSFSECIF